jgi:hypothetical protein
LFLIKNGSIIFHFQQAPYGTKLQLGIHVLVGLSHMHAAVLSQIFFFVAHTWVLAVWVS